MLYFGSFDKIVLERDNNTQQQHVILTDAKICFFFVVIFGVPNNKLMAFLSPFESLLKQLMLLATN